MSGGLEEINQYFDNLKTEHKKGVELIDWAENNETYHQQN